MNHELNIILLGLRDISINLLNSACLGSALGIIGDSKCNFECDKCPLFQVRSSDCYVDQVLEVSSQLTN